MTRPGGLDPDDADWAVILADEADLDDLAQMIADAFIDLAPSRWLITDPAARHAIFPGYFRLHLEHALTSGHVYTTPGRAAAALWLPSGVGAAGMPDGYDARLAAETGKWAERFRPFDETLSRHHPAGIAHWHLAILAVRPDRQGRGIGAALLRSGHEFLDRAGAAAYLEASSPRARDLYLRHGYALLPDAPFHLPGGAPMWPMWREPGTREVHRDAPSTGGRM